MRSWANGTSVTLTASGSTGPATWIQNGPLPPGLTLSSGGVLSGTPTTAGFFNVNFAISDNAGTVFRGLGLSVFDLHITSSGALANAMLNVPYLAHIGVAGGVAPYHFDINGSLPSGLALDPSTGDISGTRDNNGAGTLHLRHHRHGRKPRVLLKDDGDRRDPWTAIGHRISCRMGPNGTTARLECRAVAGFRRSAVARRPSPGRLLGCRPVYRFASAMQRRSRRATQKYLGCRGHSERSPFTSP